MMKIKQLGVILSGLYLVACAHTPSNTAIKSQCRLEMEAARTAVQLREQGKTKQDMLKTLPPLHPDSTRLLRVMYQSIDDTYAHTDLNNAIYGVYRLEYCLQQLRHRPVPKLLDDVLPQLLECQRQFGKQASGKMIACVRNIFSTSTASPAQIDLTE